MKKLFLAIVAVSALSSCNTTQPLYSWYNYEDATYQYKKKSTEELHVKMLEQYQKLIEKQKGIQNTAMSCIKRERKRKV